MIIDYESPRAQKDELAIFAQSHQKEANRMNLLLDGMVAILVQLSWNLRIIGRWTGDFLCLFQISKPGQKAE